METIARQFDVSRSTISRLLQEARNEGIVRITLAEPEDTGGKLAQRLSALFRIRVHIAPSKEGSSEVRRLDQVARVAAQLLQGLMHDDATLGVAWGTTTAAVASHLSLTPMQGVRVVQLNGCANGETTGTPYVGAILAAYSKAFAGSVVSFPVPAFFDYLESKHVIWRESVIQKVLKAQREVDIALFGVGAFKGPVVSHVYSAGYLRPQEILQLRSEGVVGDICTIFLKSDGSYDNITLNQRASGISPAELTKLPRRICIAAGEFRVPGISAALRSGAVTDLVIDQGTAKALLRYIELGN